MINENNVFIKKLFTDLITFFSEIDKKNYFNLDIKHDSINIENYTGNLFIIKKSNSSNSVYYFSSLSGIDHFSYDHTSDKWLNQNSLSIFSVIKTEIN